MGYAISSNIDYIFQFVIMCHVNYFPVEWVYERITAYLRKNRSLYKLFSAVIKLKF